MPETDSPAKKISSDGNAVAIRTIFDDTTPGAVKSWLYATHQGMTGYLSEAEVADWTVLGE